jgi:hypothetical protein
MYLCEGCYRLNAGGFAPDLEDKIIEVLETHRIPLPERNARGWFPR